jgi:hypothetical protein
VDAGGFGGSGISSRRPDGTNGDLQGGGGRAAAIGGGGPSGGGAATGGCAASRKGFPHLMQNFTASGIEAPHAGQIRPATAAGGRGAGATRGLPQDVQKGSPTGFWLPQFAQAAIITSFVSDYRAVFYDVVKY